MSNKVSVIIPCLWNDQKFIDMTFKCVSSMGDIGQIIISADDASFAKNVNNGLRAATGDILVICNNDIEFIQPDWLEHLIKPLREGNGISSIRTTDADGWDVEDRYEYNAKFGSLWAMTRETYEALGPLDESFGRGFYEDLDYWRRAQETNISVVKNHAGLVEHKGSESFKTYGDELLKIHYGAMLKYSAKYPDTTYLIPKDGGVVLFDKYECLDLTQDELDAMRRASMTITQVENILNAKD